MPLCQYANCASERLPIHTLCNEPTEEQIQQLRPLLVSETFEWCDASGQRVAGQWKIRPPLTISENTKLFGGNGNGTLFVPVYDNPDIIGYFGITLKAMCKIFPPTGHVVRTRRENQWPEWIKHLIDNAMRPLTDEQGSNEWRLRENLRKTSGKIESEPTSASAPSTDFSFEQGTFNSLEAPLNTGSVIDHTARFGSVWTFAPRNLYEAPNETTQATGPSISTAVNSGGSSTNPRTVSESMSLQHVLQ